MASAASPRVAPRSPLLNRGNVDALAFAEVARALAASANAHGLHVPAFRSPPRDPEATRTVKWYPGGVVVAVRIRDRAASDVLDDMVLGLLVANRKDAGHPHAGQLMDAAVRSLSTGSEVRP